MASAMRSNKDESLRQHIEELKLIKRSDEIERAKHLVSGSSQGTSSPLLPFDKPGVTLSFNNSSTEYGSGFSQSGPSGGGKKSSKSRKRPYVKKRREQCGEPTGILQQLYGTKQGNEFSGAKRKAEGVDIDPQKGALRKEPKVVPHEGLPSSQ